MKTITITIPKTKNDKWKLGFSYRGRSMHNASTVLQRIIRRLSAVNLRQKTRVVVKMTGDTSLEYTNESIASKNANYLKWISACFLEDHISKNVFKKIERETTTHPSFNPDGA